MPVVEPVETIGFFFAYNKGVPLCHTAKGRALAASPRYAVVFPQRSLTQSLYTNQFFRSKMIMEATK